MTVIHSIGEARCELHTNPPNSNSAITVCQWFVKVVIEFQVSFGFLPAKSQILLLGFYRSFLYLKTAYACSLRMMHIVVVAR